jgi:hypothetical protein
LLLSRPEKRRVSHTAVVAAAFCVVFVVLAVAGVGGLYSELTSGSYADPETRVNQLSIETQQVVETASSAMVGVSDAELQELTLLSAELMDAQFQYWMSVSFAVIVAVFVAGERLTDRFRLLIAILYTAVSFLFLARLLGSAFHFQILLAAGLDRGLPNINPGNTGIAGPMRYAILIVGGCTTIWFTLRGQIGERAERVSDVE